MDERPEDQAEANHADPHADPENQHVQIVYGAADFRDALRHVQLIRRGCQRQRDKSKPDNERKPVLLHPRRLAQRKNVVAGYQAKKVHTRTGRDAVRPVERVFSSKGRTIDPRCQRFLVLERPRTLRA